MFVANFAYAQEKPSSHQKTATPTDARYEIVQSPIIARLCFRLDRFSGEVSQLVTTRDGAFAWEDMKVVNLPTIVGPTKPRFQVFTSGILARCTLLIDTDSGMTWSLVEHKEKKDDGTDAQSITTWDPFK